MNWSIVIAIALSVIAIYLLSKIVSFVVDLITVLSYQLKIYKKEVQTRKEWERKEKEAAEYRAIIQHKKVEMIAKGCESVPGTDLWLYRENGKIKHLYDLNGRRVTLAELARAPGTKIIGNEPDLYYNSQRISKWQMLEDEAEIRKLNNA